MKNDFTLEEIKRELNSYLEKKLEPEICLSLDGEDYIIIPLQDKISFQWIGKTKEAYFKTVEELFSCTLINRLVLNRDWNRVGKIWYI